MQSLLSPDEADRLETLRQYDVLDTAPEQEFDDLTHLAAQICGTPISAITLVDEQRLWFKSRVGLTAPEVPRPAPLRFAPTLFWGLISCTFPMPPPTSDLPTALW